MAISSPLSLGKISKSASGLNYIAKQGSVATAKITRNISTGIEQKKILGSSLKLAKRKRIDVKNRKYLTDRLKSAPILLKKYRGPESLAATDKSTSLMSRMLGFIGYASAGWILGNLPTWVGLGQQFTKRVITASNILSNYGEETLDVITDLGKVFTSTFDNLSKFDFTDNSNLISNSLDELKSSLDDLGTGLSDAFAVFLKPFGYVPPLNQPSPYPDAYENPQTTPSQPPTSPPSSGGGGGGSVGQWKPILDLIASAEAPGGYETVLGGSQIKNATRMTITQVARRAGDRLDGRGNYAVGRYQFTTLRAQAKAAGLDPDKDLFSPENQDKIAVYLITGKKGLSIDKFKNDPIGSGNILAEEWAGLPVLSNYGGKRRGQSYYEGYNNNHATISADVYESKLRQFASQSTPSSTTPTPPPQPQQSPTSILSGLSSPVAALTNLVNSLTGRNQIAGQRKLQSGDVFTKSLGKDVEYVQVGDLYGSRGGAHKGIDIQAPEGTYIALREDCEVVAQGVYGNYGNVIDVWVPKYNVQLRMAHLSSIIITSGKIPAGTSFARVGSTGNASGPHIHFEYDTVKGESRGGGAGNPEAYVRLLLLTKSPNTSRVSPRPSTPLVPPVTPPAQQQNQDTNIQSNQNQLRDGIVQERRGQKIIIIDDRGTPISQTIASSGGQDISIEIDKYTLLNNFIKNKLLLDLTYL